MNQKAQYIFSVLTLMASAFGESSGENSDGVVPLDSPEIFKTQPFPDWLHAFTGLNAWPDENPPYIPLEFIDFENIVSDPRREFGTCPPDRSTCSFDCYKCISYDDAYTCPKLSQTFDDGPSPSTPKLLKALTHNTTFFTVGLNVVKYPEVYQQIQQKGHLLGLHTWSHKFLPSLSNEEIIAQFQWSIWAMNATGSHLPKWYRPPYGGIDNRVRSIARQFGMQAVLWDYDSFDWKLESVPPQRTESEIYSDVQKWRHKTWSPAGLILEHDGMPKTVNAGIEISKIIGPDQLTVAQCVGGIDYIRTF
ncbi:BA75_01440T0 [Komagataella pastoris]|uniref:chitin deacetylase n=1 Tax=Komagataella pastoris TaxID=4922 RepID=A0A1B2JA31_PICPA|nr:BA75_01440T0 [Komagataella pastoris]